MKVLCKRTVTRESNSVIDVYISFLVGEYYNITKNSTRVIYIDGILFWHLFDTMDGLYFFEDYFYSVKELRKKKLDLLKSVDTI